MHTLASDDSLPQQQCHALHELLLMRLTAVDVTDPPFGVLAAGCPTVTSRSISKPSFQSDDVGLVPTFRRLLASQSHHDVQTAASRVEEMETTQWHRIQFRFRITPRWNSRQSRYFSSSYSLDFVQLASATAFLRDRSEFTFPSILLTDNPIISSSSRNSTISEQYPIPGS